MMSHCLTAFYLAEEWIENKNVAIKQNKQQFKTKNKKTPSDRLSVVVFKAPPRRLQRQHSWKNAGEWSLVSVANKGHE